MKMNWKSREDMMRNRTAEGWVFGIASCMQCFEKWECFVEPTTKTTRLQCPNCSVCDSEWHTNGGFPISGKELLQRIENYLSNGGLFNPEMMNHQRVQSLLMDCRHYIESNESPTPP